LVEMGHIPAGLTTPNLTFLDRSDVGKLNAPLSVVRLGKKAAGGVTK